MQNRCWARSVSECSDKISGEHLISRALFPRGVTVQGFPWCRNESKTIGINSLRALVLCKKHNSDLSDLDAAALDFWSVLHSAFGRFAEKAKILNKGLQPEFPVTRYLLEGPTFERWCFKTAINMATSGNIRGLVADWMPPDRLVRYVVNGDPLADGYGVGMEAGIGDWIADANRIQFHGLRASGAPLPTPDLEGFVIGFRGLRFVGTTKVRLSDTEPPAELGADRRIRRLGEFKLPSINVAIAFDWTGRHRNDADPNVVHARSSVRGGPGLAADECT